MHKYITLFFSVSLFLFSCKGDKTPDGIIKRNQMTSLLTEVHLVDGRMYGIFQSQDSLNKYGTSRYDALFKRYHTDSAQFKKSFKYYATKPAELQKMYEQILATLKQKTDSLNKVQRKTDSLNRIKQRELNKSKI
jgi:hypothetical protein